METDELKESSLELAKVLKDLNNALDNLRISNQQALNALSSAIDKTKKDNGVCGFSNCYEWGISLDSDDNWLCETHKGYLDFKKL